MRRLVPLAAVCLLSGCATLGGGGDETGRKYVVFFTKDSSQIEPAGSAVIARVALIARRHTDQGVVVSGYAAAHGDLNADAQISVDRANAVTALLHADGVAGTRITQNARPPSNEVPGVAARRVEIGFTSQP